MINNFIHLTLLIILSTALIMYNNCQMESNIQPENRTVPENKSSTKEKIPGREQIILATNFLYKNYHAIDKDQQRKVDDTDGIRGDLALESIKKAIDQGIGVVACDGGSSNEFLAKLEGFKDKGLTIVASDIAGRGPQRRKAFEIATRLPNGKVIIYFQPEKVGLMDNLAEVSKPILDGTADIVIPKRNPELFEKSYPDYMRESELRVNKTYDYIMKRAGLMSKDEGFDWFFGPVVFKNDPEIVEMFLKKYRIDDSIYSRIGAEADPERHSDGHYFPIILALFNKLRVVSVEVPFIYPKSQRENESFGAVEAFKERRKKDAAAYRLEALHFLAYLRGDPASKIKEVEQT